MDGVGTWFTSGRIGFFCGSQVATINRPLTSATCTPSNYGATRLRIPAEGTEDDVNNPPRIAPRHLFDVGVGVDNLFHADKKSLPLYRAAEGTDVVAEWKSWARVLGMPLLVAEADGILREPFARIGALRIAAPTARRRRRGAIKSRRPSILLRRKTGDPRAPRTVHRGGHEIIARN